MKRVRIPLAAILLGLLLLPGCGGGDGGLFDGLGAPSFWATDFGTNAYYQTSAQEMASGPHCRIYVESGQNVPQGMVDNIVTQFENVIYPAVTAAFGNPPLPGVDNDVRVTLLLLKIRDTVAADGGLTAGYFHPINEFMQADIAASGFSDKSNEREMIYLNTAFLAPGLAQTSRTIAHELQHMVHWEQKDHRLSTPTSSVTDDVWLNEAMSEAAPFFCGFGPDNGRVGDFTRNPATSLTIWNGELANYGTVYMWSQYLYDRYPRTLFGDVLRNDEIGVTSVENTLALLSPPTTFRNVFFDWTMANLVATDNATRDAVGLLPGWSYLSPVSLSAIFSNIDRIDPLVTPALRQWTGDYYKYTRVTEPFTGTVSWTAGSGQTSASFFNVGDNTVIENVISGSVLPYTNTGYLVVRNESGTDNATPTPGTVTVTPSVILDALLRMPSAGARPVGVTASGGPHMKCGLDRFERKGREMRARGLRVRF